jgi:hypothetical protein
MARFSSTGEIDLAAEYFLLGERERERFSMGEREI